MENVRYKVVVNREMQYALWIDGKHNAPGWHDAGIEGMKENCLAYIRELWTDMRPFSLRGVALRNDRCSLPVSEESGIFA